MQIGKGQSLYGSHTNEELRSFVQFGRSYRFWRLGMNEERDQQWKSPADAGFHLHEKGTKRGKRKRVSVFLWEQRKEACEFDFAKTGRVNSGC